MRARDVVELLLLSVLWGAVYLFTRAAAPAFGPAPLVAARLGMAALMLLPLLAWRGQLRSLAAHPRQLLMLGNWAFENTILDPRSILQRLARAASQATPCALRAVRAAELPC